MKHDNLSYLGKHYDGTQSPIKLGDQVQVMFAQKEAPGEIRKAVWINVIHDKEEPMDVLVVELHDERQLIVNRGLYQSMKLVKRK